MQKMFDDIEKATETYEKLKKDLSLVKAGKTTSDGKNVSADVYAPRPRVYAAAADACTIRSLPSSSVMHQERRPLRARSYGPGALERSTQ